MLNAKHVVTAAKGLVEGSRRSETILREPYTLFGFHTEFSVFCIHILCSP